MLRCLPHADEQQWSKNNLYVVHATGLGLTHLSSCHNVLCLRFGRSWEQLHGWSQAIAKIARWGGANRLLIKGSPRHPSQPSCQHRSVVGWGKGKSWHSRLVSMPLVRADLLSSCHNVSIHWHFGRSWEQLCGWLWVSANRIARWVGANRLAIEGSPWHLSQPSCQHRYVDRWGNRKPWHNRLVSTPQLRWWFMLYISVFLQKISVSLWQF